MEDAYPQLVAIQGSDLRDGRSGTDSHHYQSGVRIGVIAVSETPDLCRFRAVS